MKNEDKKILFSGIQPTGNLHIGNYLGAISQWKEIEDNYRCFFCVVDYHAITNNHDHRKIYEATINMAKIYLASGIDPKKSIIFRQSDITEHTELTWILNCVAARISDLKKMTQFKDKAGEKQENVSVGLFDYPVLMAADILLYNTDVVPVGDDQNQHVELARDLAKRFNNKFGETFKIPKAIIKKEGARIKSLQEPTKKMSKSDKSVSNCIYLADDPEIGRKKILKAITDNDTKIYYDEKNKPAIANLLTIYSAFTRRKIEDIVLDYKNKGYGDFKKDLGDIVFSFLSEFRIKYHSYKDEEIEELFNNNKEKVKKIAEENLKKIKEKIGLLEN